MRVKTLAVLGLMSLTFIGCLEPSGVAPKTKSALHSDKDRYSYALGASFGKQVEAQLIARDSLDIDFDLFVQAFREYYFQDSGKYLMNDSTIFATLNELSQKAQEERIKRDSIAGAIALEKEKEFLEKNKTAEGVVTTESGLQYKVIQAGDGAQPSDTSLVSVHYTGTLLDGTEFDSSIKRGQPMTFPVNAVIPGWTEVLKLMKVGEKVQAWIPSALGYGARNTGVIPPNSLLVFEIELLEIVNLNENGEKKEAAEKTTKVAEKKPAAKPAEAKPAEAKPEAQPAAN